jgi:hypothetical protein
MNGQQARMYRLYFFDEFHRVESWQALHCASDAEAFAEAAALMGDSIAVEIVEGIRIVGTFTASGMAGLRAHQCVGAGSMKSDASDDGR